MSQEAAIARKADDTAINKCSRFVQIHSHNLAEPEEEQDLAYEVRLVVGMVQFQITTEWLETMEEAEELKAELTIALWRIAMQVNSPL